MGGLDNITTNDICAGRLKAVLALFFALSRFKQQAKQIKGSSNAELHANTQQSNTLGGGVGPGDKNNLQIEHAQSVKNGNETMANR